MTIPVHLLATDISGLDLLETTELLECTAVVFPENRRVSPKVVDLCEAASQLGLSTFMHPRGADLPDDMPVAECCVSWMYSQILPVKSFARYPLGLLNMHGGHIPTYRGANVLQWAIINGETELWVTWHEIVKEVDAGPIWSETAIPILENMTAWDVREAMLQAGIDRFPDAIERKLEAKFPVRLPDLSAGHIWPARRPKDGLLLPGRSRREVWNLVRALCPPWPAAFIETEAGRHYITAVVGAPAPSTKSYRCADGDLLHLLIDESPGIGQNGSDAT